MRIKINKRVYWFLFLLCFELYIACPGPGAAGHNVCRCAAGFIGLGPWLLLGARGRPACCCRGPGDCERPLGPGLIGGAPAGLMGRA